MTDECTLCGLPTPDPPETAPDVPGAFCCRGCLEVSRTVGDVDGLETVAIRERANTDDTPGRATAPGRLDDAVVDEGVAPDHVEDEEGDLSEVFLAIDGMHCTTCEAFVALRGESRDGIASVDASYATDTARIQYDPEQIDEAEIKAALSGYGYVARHIDVAAGEEFHDEDTAQRLLVGGVMAMLIMPWYLFFLYPSYVGIETGILTADMTTPVGLYFPMAIIGLFASVVVFYSGWPILRGAYVSLRTRRPNMDLLLSVAILAAFAYSTVALATGSIHLYYDVSVAIVLVVTAGSHYESRLKQQATGLISELATLRVTEATRRRADGTYETVAVDDLAPGDEVVVRQGERVPLDGTVVEGTAAVDEAVLTGESLPHTRGPGDEVVGGSTVTDSALVIAVGADAENTLDRITATLWAVQSDRTSVQRFADKLATVFVPLVLLIGAGVAGWRLIAGELVSTALLTGLTVLVAACPCAMGLATPLAIAGGLRDALERGVVVTDRSLFERAPSVDTVVFDKTGTLTTGEMTVREVVGNERALDAAAAVERRSSHPVASAIVQYVTIAADGGPIQGEGDADTVTADGDSLLATVTDFERHPGEGVSGVVDGERVVVGTPGLVERRGQSLPEDLREAVEDARAVGDLPVVVGLDGEPVAVAVVGDAERAGWQGVLDRFADRRVIVLTGDDETAAIPFRDHPAVDDVFAGVPPDGKLATLRYLSDEGTTAMVGDGTNDAPALGAADVGIAIAGTARTADAADVVLVDGSLADVPAVFDLASATRRRIRENIGWALCYNAIAIPLAATGVLNPLFAAIAMATSSILIVTNSRRRLL